MMFWTCNELSAYLNLQHSYVNWDNTLNANWPVCSHMIMYKFIVQIQLWAVQWYTAFPLLKETVTISIPLIPLSWNTTLLYIAYPR